MEKIDLDYNDQLEKFRLRLSRRADRDVALLRFSHSLVLCFAIRLCKVVNFFVVVFIRAFSHFTYLTSTILYWGYVMQAVAIFFQYTNLSRKY